MFRFARHILGHTLIGATLLWMLAASAFFSDVWVWMRVLASFPLGAAAALATLRWWRARTAQEIPALDHHASADKVQP